VTAVSKEILAINSGEKVSGSVPVKTLQLAVNQLPVLTTMSIVNK